MEAIIVAVVAAVLSIIGGIIASSLQHASWEMQRRRSIEDAQLQRAQELCDTIIQLFDKRLYRLRRVIWATRPHSNLKLEAERADYTDSLRQWNDHFNTIRTNMMSLYGYSTVLEFETRIHQSLQSIGSAVERSIRDNSSVQADVEQRLNVLSKRAYAFLAELQRSIRDRKLPHFDNNDAINFENADKLPLMYLIKRLYGVSTKMRGI